MSRSGAATHTLPKSKYFENLAFLCDNVASHETFSNILLPISVGAYNAGNTKLDIIYFNLSTGSSTLPAVVLEIIGKNISKKMIYLRDTNFRGY